IPTYPAPPRLLSLASATGRSCSEPRTPLTSMQCFQLACLGGDVEIYLRDGGRVNPRLPPSLKISQSGAGCVDTVGLSHRVKPCLIAGVCSGEEEYRLSRGYMPPTRLILRCLPPNKQPSLCRAFP
ncbi:unnamed protein product, partial [Pleuronectes platessa]